jgi:tetratricopeptide (TPR) repeat protein
MTGKHRYLPFLLLMALVALPATAQTDTEIEAESITEQGTLDPFAADESELQPIFDEAERLFRSFDQPNSIPLFDRLIVRLESDHKREPLSPEFLGMLIQCRSHRAEVHFNLGDNDLAEADLRRILELDPSWQMNPDLVSPKLVGLTDRLRREMVGEIVVLVEPMDASITLAEHPVEIVGETARVLAGTWPLVIRRPGFTSVEEDVEVRAGRSVTVDHTLERLSAVVRLRVRPAGAEALIDGAPAAVAERNVIPESGGEEELAIEGLEPGQHTLTLQLAEFREMTMSFEVLDLDDYYLPSALLELLQGEALLTGLLEGAQVTVDGEPASPRYTADGALLALAPGTHSVEVTQPGVGGFRQQVTVADQQVVDVAVELQPTLTFLGVLGDDRLTAGDLTSSLTESLGALREWIWIDRSIDASTALSDLGLSAEEMRRVGALAGPAGAPEWEPVQSRFDSEFAGSLYLVAVLGDDLYATTADFWLWSPAPWLAAPTKRTVSIDSAEELAELARLFDAPTLPSRARLGARWIDSEAAGGPVTVSLVEGGPADAATLAIGDRVLEMNGAPVASVAELIRGATADAVQLRVGTTAVAREIELRPQAAAAVLPVTATDVLDPVLAARLSLELLRSQASAPRWLLQLNQAALLIRARDYEAAIQLLRRIEAPAQPGLGRAMVDYWLGTTLLALDARVYADAARSALERSLEQPGARLYHDDGPLLAPRARARLAQLDRLLGN